MSEITQRLTELEGRIAAALRLADERRTLSTQQQESCITIEVELAGTFEDFLEQTQRDLQQVLQLIAKEELEDLPYYAWSSFDTGHAGGARDEE